MKPRCHLRVLSECSPLWVCHLGTSQQDGASCQESYLRALYHLRKEKWRERRM